MLLWLEPLYFRIISHEGNEQTPRISASVLCRRALKSVRNKWSSKRRRARRVAWLTFVSSVGRNMERKDGAGW